jgi:hypothetical protein
VLFRPINNARNCDIIYYIVYSCDLLSLTYKLSNALISEQNEKNFTSKMLI